MTAWPSLAVSRLGFTIALSIRQYRTRRIAVGDTRNEKRTCSGMANPCTETFKSLPAHTGGRLNPTKHLTTALCENRLTPPCANPTQSLAQQAEPAKPKVVHERLVHGLGSGSGFPSTPRSGIHAFGGQRNCPASDQITADQDVLLK